MSSIIADSFDGNETEAATVDLDYEDQDPSIVVSQALAGDTDALNYLLKQYDKSEAPEVKSMRAQVPGNPAHDALHGSAIVSCLLAGETVVIPLSALDAVTTACDATEKPITTDGVLISLNPGGKTCTLTFPTDEPLTPMERSRRRLAQQRAGYPQALVDWYNDGADGAISWGDDGDFDDCVAVAGKYIDNPEGFCNLRHQDATGAPPGKAPGESESKSVRDWAEWDAEHSGGYKGLDSPESKVAISSGIVADKLGKQGSGASSADKIAAYNDAVSAHSTAGKAAIDAGDVATAQVHLGEMQKFADKAAKLQDSAADSVRSSTGRIERRIGTVNGKPGRATAVANYYRPKMVAAYTTGTPTAIAAVLPPLWTDGYYAGVDSADGDTPDDWSPGWAETNQAPDDASSTLLDKLAAVGAAAAGISAFLSSPDNNNDPADLGDQATDTEAASSAEDGAQDTYASNGVSQWNIELDDGACEKCQDAEADGPYDVGDDDVDDILPVHPGCGCESRPITSDDSDSGGDTESTSSAPRHFQVRRWSGEKRSKVAKGLLIAIDYDKTWSAAPELFTALARALRKAKAKVVVLSANEDAEADMKAQGIGDAYDSIVVVAEPSGPAKAKWLKENNADLLIDNKHANVEAAMKVTNAAEFFPRTQPVPEHKHAHPHSHSSHTVRADGVEMCCNGQTAADHRADSVDGKCCVDREDDE